MKVIYDQWLFCVIMDKLVQNRWTWNWAHRREALLQSWSISLNQQSETLFWERWHHDCAWLNWSPREQGMEEKFSILLHTDRVKRDSNRNRLCVNTCWSMVTMVTDIDGRQASRGSRGTCLPPRPCLPQMHKTVNLWRIRDRLFGLFRVVWTGNIIYIVP